MAAGDPANLVQALTTMVSTFALNQNGQLQSENVAQTSTSITNSPMTLAVNSPVSQASSSSTNASSNARSSSSRLVFSHKI